MKELFIPYTEALELKELGFNEKCLAAYTNRGKFHQTSSDYWDNDSIKMIKEYTTIKLKVLAPLYSQAFKWFRDKYNLILDILPFYDEEQLPLSLTNKQKPKGYFIWDYYDDEFDLENSPNYKIYEEAELECIRKLIEIVKKEQKK